MFGVILLSRRKCYVLCPNIYCSWNKWHTNSVWILPLAYIPETSSSSRTLAKDRLHKDASVQSAFFGLIINRHKYPIVCSCWLTYSKTSKKTKYPKTKHCNIRTECDLDSILCVLIIFESSLMWCTFTSDTYCTCVFACHIQYIQYALFISWSKWYHLLYKHTVSF